jgi:hypothetical protein
MASQLCFFVSVVFSFIAWGILTSQYVWPRLRPLERSQALRPILILHTFRFIGLAFLIPGVTTGELPSTFTHAAAYGDFVAALLALLSLVLLRRPGGVAVVWLFNLWGAADLLNAPYQALSAGIAPGQFGTTYFIPTVIVPMLLISHWLVFRILLRPTSAPTIREAV